MNANIYEYGTDPKTGLKRRLVRDTVVVQEETSHNTKPSAVVHLRLQTYVEVETENEEGVVEVEVEIITDVTAGYKVTKGEISKEVNDLNLPKYTYEWTGSELIKIPVVDEEGNQVPRDNGYENIIYLSKLPISFDTVLDNGIKEVHNLA